MSTSGGQYVTSLPDCILGSCGNSYGPCSSSGIDPRGLAVYSAPVVVGVVEEPWRTVIRPDKLPKPGTNKPQPNGTYVVELPQRPLDYLVGYIFRVHVQEVLKSDRWVRVNKTIDIFVPFRLEGGASLPTKEPFLLALAPFSPKKEDFERTSVIKAGQSVSGKGASFDLRGRYYVVAGDANGAVPITAKNRRLIEEIRAAIRMSH